MIFVKFSDFCVIKTLTFATAESSFIDMKSVLEYRDYHAFMQDYYDSRKKSGAFSWREFSKNAGFSSSNYMKLVCMGKSKLSKVKTAQVAKAMGLIGHEAEYFEQLVIFGNAIKDSVKKTAFLVKAEMHKEMGSMAVRAVDRYNASERYFTGMTIGVNEETYSRIVDEINICAKKIAAIANESDNLNQVYGLNLQLFPFTNKIEGESHA